MAAWRGGRTARSCAHDVRDSLSVGHYCVAWAHRTQSHGINNSFQPRGEKFRNMQAKSCRHVGFIVASHVMRARTQRAMRRLAKPLVASTDSSAKRWSGR